jgi:phage tail sheath protein FI
VDLAPRGDEEAAELQLALIAHCQELRDRVALLDAPGPSSARQAPSDALEWRQRFDSSHAALYYPWLQVRDPRAPGAVRPVPPSGHIAGVCARVDQQVGVHKPPANEVVEGALDLLTQVDDITHGDLNDGGVNAIRARPGQQVRVLGARTLARDLEWRFLNIRRLLLMIEESLEESARWTVFEPNSQAPWRDVDRTARSFLDDLWRRGMLGGATADEAYLVRCDETTNPPTQLDAGRLTCLIGVLPPPPAEFVVVRLVRTPTGVEFQEGPGG